MIYHVSWSIIYIAKYYLDNILSDYANRVKSGHPLRLTIIDGLYSFWHILFVSVTLSKDCNLFMKYLDLSDSLALILDHSIDKQIYCI